MSRLPGRDGLAPAEEPAEPQQRLVSERLARLIDGSPVVRDIAIEVGVIDRQWLDQPARRQPSMAPPLEMLRRLLEQTVERYPSGLASVGLNAGALLGPVSGTAAWRAAARTPFSAATVVFTDIEGSPATRGRTVMTRP